MAHNPPLDPLFEAIRDNFKARFQRPPQWVACVPGRVNLIGEHVDYNQGLVLPLAIDRYTFVAVALVKPSSLSARKVATVHSTQPNETAEIYLDHLQPVGPKTWVSYIAGVLAGFSELGCGLPAIEMLVESNVPIGSGLSSSAALEVAVATALEAVLGITIDKRAKALLCQQAEHRFVGVPCGIMDQFISVFAEPNSLMLLDCRDQTFRLVPFDDRDVSILIVNSNVKHDLASSQYSIRRQECHSAALALGATSLRDLSESELKSRRNRLTDVEYRRAKHVISEIDRTGQCVKAIEARDWSAAGRLLYLSHESLRDDFDVSCRELDILVELAGRIGLKGGVYGSRLTGGGFGGCTVSLIARDCIEPVIRSLLADYRTATGRAANAFVTRPSSGARLVLGGI